MKRSEFAGENPYFLLIRRYGPFAVVAEHAVSTVVDLDTSWTKTYADLLREPGVWMLCDKERSFAEGKPYPVLIKQVEPGEQPFYAKRHVGVINIASGEDIGRLVAHGIGVKERDGRVDGAFILPNGSITTDDDVYWVGDRMNKGQL